MFFELLLSRHVILTLLGILELNRSNRTDPDSNLRRILLIHVEEVRHHRFDDGLALVIRRHSNRPPEYLEQSTVPVLDNVVQGGKSRINECAQVLANWFAALPFRDAELARCVFGQAVKAFPKSLVIDFFPESKQPTGPPGSLYKAHLQTAAKEIGIVGHFGWHTFRHTYATLLKGNGEDVKVVQELMRHANISVTLNVYAQAITQTKRDAQSRVVSLLLDKNEKNQALRLIGL
jgi:integrase